MRKAILAYSIGGVIHMRR